MKYIILSLLVFSSSVFAVKVVTPRHLSEIENPWYTGPLITPSSVVVPAGHINFEPYIYVLANSGFYDSHGNVVKEDLSWVNSFQPIIQIGLTSWMDIQFLPTIVYNYNKHHAQWLYSDSQIILDFQLLSPKHIDDWTPYIKFFLIEIFPTGQYRNLNPKKRGVDLSGTGSFRTVPGIVIGELFHLWAHHFIIARLALQYDLPAPVHLKGFNAYGGGYGTNARFFPAQSLELTIGVELTLSKNWVLACDFEGLWTQKTHYSGNPGKNADGTPAILGVKASSQYAFAPALEYNWSESLGIIGGSWFTFAGCNAPRFWSAVLAVNYYH
jgi:hypothetical protein